MQYKFVFISYAILKDKHSSCYAFDNIIIGKQLQQQQQQQQQKKSNTTI